MPICIHTPERCIDIPVAVRYPLQDDKQTGVKDVSTVFMYVIMRTLHRTQGDTLTAHA